MGAQPLVCCDSKFVFYSNVGASGDAQIQNLFAIQMWVAHVFYSSVGASGCSKSSVCSSNVGVFGLLQFIAIQL